MDKVNAYEVLNLPRSASPEQIKASYRAKALVHHPDRGGYAENFLCLQDAFEILSDPKRRLNEGEIRQFRRLPLRIQPSLSPATSILFQNLDLLSERLPRRTSR